MPGLRLYTSNRLEILADKLAEVLRKPLASPFDPEVIVVQSRGMARWLSMQLAQRHGACANCRFPFPNHFVQEMFRSLLPNLPEFSPFDPKTMTWRILNFLPSCLNRSGFESLRRYLREEVGQLKRFQLSERIADTFDQYLVFRPEMVCQWEKGQGDHWQAVLWRELVEACGNQHRAGLGRHFIEAVKAAPNSIVGLLERISVFGISALPRFHMEILSGVARFAQVNLFLMNPCREYWGDIVSEWEMTRRTATQDEEDVSPEELHMEKGNSLLGSLGTLGRDFFDLINDFPLDEFPCFEEPEGNDLLCQIQSDILDLRDAQQKPGEKRRLMADDTSVQFHSCHSPMREIEVLHDQLLHMFEVDPDLKPKDILVMTPDIEAYSPYIQAVFDMPADDGRRIPFSIADRSIRRESEIVDAFLAILNLEGGRFGASQVLNVLESPAVQRRFGLTDTDLDLIRRWVSETRIRWGVDGQNRIELGLSAFAENTWRAGLDRLVLGYAMPGQGEKLYGGILPYDFVEGGDASALGKLCEFTTQLFSRIKSLERPRTLKGWSGFLMGLLETFLMTDEASEREMQILRQRLNDLDNMQEMAGFEGEIDFKVIQWHLTHSLEREGFGFGFITGGVTFCAMLPMRSIPFKVICLVGMNNDAYPRESKPLGFDLMAKHPKPGDRSRRDDDRYLFLEAILSARAKFYISYVGQNIRDNSLIPPSVLVSELTDYIGQGFEMVGKNIMEQIIIKHRLQAFSPAYFKKEGKLFSYSRENFEAAQQLVEMRRDSVPFISGGLSKPEDTWRTVDIRDLCNFFNNPSRFLLNKRLGIYLEQREILLDDRETFELKGLDKYLLEQNLVKNKLEGQDLKDFLAVTRASGQLPHGTLGECVFERLRFGVERFADRVASFTREKRLPPLDLDLDLSGFRLTGRLDNVYTARLVQYRYAKVTPKDRLKVWIHHLALNSTRTGNYPCMSMLAGLLPAGKEPQWVAYEYPPLEESEEILKNLLTKYWAGLVVPLHFFPSSSWDYVYSLFERDKPQGEALESARNAWSGTEYRRGECEDPYYHLCFGNTDPFDSEFESNATAIFKPLLDHQKELTE